MWEPIHDLPQDLSTLTDGELGPLRQFWEDLREDLSETRRLERFLAELKREWAIETGQIEGIYDVERGVTATLIERGINTDLIPRIDGQKAPELIAAIIRDHMHVLEGLFEFVKGSRPLSKSYIHELHAELLRNQTTATAQDQFGHVFEAELLKGQYKKRPNNPTREDGTVHLYCPPEHVESEMERLIAMHRDHECAAVPVEIQAAWLHHRFAQIHPYQDGNGRVARAIGSLVFLKAGWFPIVVTREERLRYLDALESGDAGDLTPLTAFFVDLQKRSLRQATKIAADVVPAETVDEAIMSAKRALTGSVQRLEPTAWLRARETADVLMAIAKDRLQQIRNTLDQEIGSSRPDASFRVNTDRPKLSGGDLAWLLSRGSYFKLFSLDLRHDSSTNAHSIHVEASALGAKFRGLIEVTVALYADLGLPEPASDQPFQINYAETPENAERRFRPWLERSLTRALTLWRRSL